LGSIAKRLGLWRRETISQITVSYVVSGDREIHYNREIHTSNGTPRFETFFGYFPPSPLDVVYGQQGGVRKTSWEMH